MNFGPFVGWDVVAECEVIGVYGRKFTSKEVNRVFIDCGGMRFEFDDLTLAFIAEFGPVILFSLVGNIHAVEVPEHTFVSVEPSVNIELVVMDSGGMIRSRGDVLPFDFHFCPPQVERVFEVCFDHDVGRLSFVEVFVLPNIVRLFQFHNKSILSITGYI